MKYGALLGGLAGVCALTLLHETARRKTKKAPRMDKLGMEALAKGIVAGSVMKALDSPSPATSSS